MKENLEYYKELAAYYKDEALLKASELPKWVWTLVAGVIALLLLVFMARLGGEETPPPTAPVTTSEAPKPMISVKDLTLLEAKQKLQSAGFQSISEEQLPEFAGNSKNEIVIEQAPTEGTLVKSTDKILLSYGDRELYKKSTTVVTMPSVVGISYKQALKKLETAGFAKVTGDLPKGVLEAQAVVASQDPAAGTEVNLNAPVVLDPKAGFDMPVLRTKLQESFAPYPRFSKVESPGNLNLRLTLKAPDPSLKDPKTINERARAYKVGIETSLGYTVGKVFLVNPGTNLVGDSSKVTRSATAQGLTKEVAEQACDANVQETGSSIEINWETGILSELVDDQNVSITVTGILKGSNDSEQEIVASCVVTGTNEAPIVSSSSVK